MALLNQDTSEAFRRKDAVDQTTFSDMFPTETNGNGLEIANNIKTGAAQGKSSFIRKVRCQQCGLPVDLNKVDHTGGSIDGQGAGGGVSVATYSATLPNGTVHTEEAGTQEYRLNSGCPLCFSRNSSKSRIDRVGADPWVRQVPVGF